MWGFSRMWELTFSVCRQVPNPKQLGSVSFRLRTSFWVWVWIGRSDSQCCIKDIVRTGQRHETVIGKVGGFSSETGQVSEQLSPIGHSPLAKVHCNFVNTSHGLSTVGEIPVYFRQLTTVLNKAISKPVSRAKIRKHQEKQNKRLIAQVPTSDLQTIMCFAVDQQPLTTRVESAAQVDGPNDEINKQVEDVDMSLKKSIALSPTYYVTFVIGEYPVGESLIGEIRESPLSDR
ncbi:hypothetical protein I4U23_011325 [Adineta vaga]|nr:hypothetical protein I4U23_011325 [Adineta vaga]